MPITHTTTTGKIGATQWNEPHDLSDFLPSEIGAIAGSGVVGQVAEFVTDTGTIQAAKLIAPAVNILTLTNAAASTLALNITAAKTLTLTAADNYTIVFPASGTVPLLGTANVYTVNQFIDGSTNSIQLRVQGHSTQTATLQTWENSSATVLASINNTGDFGIGTAPVTTSGLNMYKAVSSSSSFNGINAYFQNAGTGDSKGINFIIVSRGNKSGLFGISGNTLSQGTGANGSLVLVAGASVYNSFEATSTYNISATNSYGINLAAPTTNVTTGTLTITNAAGVNVENQGNAYTVNAYGLYIKTQSGATTLNYAIYTNLGLNRFGDQLEIVGAVDRNQLKVTGFTTQTLPVGYLIDNTSATNTVRNVLQLETQSTGTAAAGLGAGLLYSLETATGGTNQTAGVISASWIDATNATRKAKLSLSAYDTAARLGLEIEASGTESMIGFYGVSPIARAVLATGVGASVDDVITALQNLGLVKQS